MPTKLSVVICTLNEEQNIKQCIEAAIPVADEVIVVDSGSSDLTVEIAKSAGALVFYHPFEGFGKQKKWADKQAQYEYILSLDADEVLSDQLQKNIVHIKQNPDADGYIINRLTNYCGSWIRHGGWYPDSKLRLYRKSAGQWNDSDIHEQIKMKSGSVVKLISGDLLHYSYRSISQHIARLDKYSTLKAQQKFKKGKSAGCFRVILAPVAKFIKQYFFQAGFLDGYYGFVIASISAFGQFITYVKTRQLFQSK